MVLQIHQQPWHGGERFSVAAQGLARFRAAVLWNSSVGCLHPLHSKSLLTYGLDRRLRGLGGAEAQRRFRSSAPHDSTNESYVSVASKQEEVVIALGGNIGNRLHNFENALKLMRNAGIQVKKHGCLYETLPMHVTDQPLFLNSAITASTSLDPHSLLNVLKGIETQLGRSSEGIKYGPRPIDLDIIFYGNLTLKSEVLQIPHSMFRDRPFVLAPVVDLLDDPDPNYSYSHWSQVDGGIRQHWLRLGGESCFKAQGMRRVLPFKNRLLDFAQRTQIMGILNLTPDSFSDGGKYMSVDRAVAHIEDMINGGADFVDIGAQSTRPNARRLRTEEELGRLVPVMEAVSELAGRDKVLISVDTFDSAVAREAVALGADMINDVSAGRLDEKMLPTIAELGVPCVLMHMRGDPSTMQTGDNVKYGSVVEEVAREISGRVEEAESVGVPAWRMVTDPGFGFSKTVEQNLSLLRDLSGFRACLSRTAVRHGPMVAGLSRKSFLGKISGVERGEDRDAASIAAFVASVFGGANILRVHNVKAVRQAVMVADALLSQQQQQDVKSFVST